MNRPGYYAFLLSLIVLLPLSDKASGQVRIGLQLSPTVTYSRAHIEQDSVSLRGSGAALRPIAAIKFDFPLGRQYFLSTGVQYFSRPVKLQRQTAGEGSVSEEYKVQHLQLPIMIKMLTSEFSLDKRIYAQMGISAEVNIHEESSTDNAKTVDDVSPLAASFLLGAGVEFRLGIHTYLQAGVAYNRGLTNLVRNSAFAPKPVVKNDGFSIDITLLF